MVYSAKSDDTNTISQFTRLKYIYITTNGSSTPADYQVKLTITYEPEMQAAFQDIRFNTKAGGYIDYWIESKTDGVTADVWIELPDAITDPGNDVIQMYYGNAGLSSESSGANTFIQWHGVETVQYIDSLSITPTNIIYETKAKFTSATHNIRFGISNNQDHGLDDSASVSNNSGDAYYGAVRNEGAVSYDRITPALNVDQYYDFKFIITTNTFSWYVDGVKKGTDITTNIPNETCGLSTQFYGGTGMHDYAFVHKYITNEPTPSYGTAQHQRRTPQFIN